MRKQWIPDSSFCPHKEPGYEAKCYHGVMESPSSVHNTVVTAAVFQVGYRIQITTHGHGHFNPVDLPTFCHLVSL